MPTASKKATSKSAVTANNSMLVKTSKINVFQVTILVLLLAVIGVVYKVYSHGSAANPYYSVCPTPHPNISQGTSNYNCTRYLQWSLNQLGKGLTVDGSFGPATTTAVKSFQTSKGLYPDGTVGINTWTALDKVVPPTGTTMSVPVSSYNYGTSIYSYSNGTVYACKTSSYVYMKVKTASYGNGVLYWFDYNKSSWSYNAPQNTTSYFHVAKGGTNFDAGVTSSGTSSYSAARFPVTSLANCY